MARSYHQRSRHRVCPDLLTETVNNMFARLQAMRDAPRDPEASGPMINSQPLRWCPPLNQTKQDTSERAPVVRRVSTSKQDGVVDVRIIPRGDPWQGGATG